MTFSYEEEQILQVMKAIYDSGIPISFKGSMTMKAFLMESGYTGEVRHTFDVDANWNTEAFPTDVQMVKSLQNALTNSNVHLNVSLFRMYGKGRSAGFTFSNQTTGKTLFSMDMDVNRPSIITRLYEIRGVKFYGTVPAQMIADKVSAISTDKVFRRAKDVIDLYYYSEVFSYDKDDVLDIMKKSGRPLGTFNGFLHRREELRHAYERFNLQEVSKPPFEEAYQTVKSYIDVFLPPG